MTVLVLVVLFIGAVQLLADWSLAGVRDAAEVAVLVATRWARAR